ncbi:MAG: hypothetical protein OXS47_04810 [Chloroflexota bacterium]|nr:hypothetical protein [Chloroflexota bacterium]
MAASTFDSREAYHRLREGGMDEPAANAVVEILSPFVTRDILQAELANVQANVRADLADVRSDLATIQGSVQADLATFQLRIVTYVAAANLGIATIAVAVAALVT